jgi:hypothetical protein
MNLVSGYSGRICVELSNDCEGGGRQIRVRTDEGVSMGLGRDQQ